MRIRLPFLTAVLTVALIGPTAALATSDEVTTTKKTTAKAMLAALTVSEEPTNNLAFPPSLEKWAKSKVKGCKTIKDQVLGQEALDPAPNDCTPFRRYWIDPWRGRKMGAPSFMQVVRLVQVGEAWQSGANLWDARTQAAYGNDVGYFGTLVAVTRSAADKRDQAEPQTWLPTVKSLRCDYVTQWISVKYRWGLSVDPVEKAALAKTLGSCKTVKIPVVKRARVTLAPIPAGTSAG